MNLKKLLNRRCLLEMYTSKLSEWGDSSLVYNCVLSYRIPIKFMGRIWYYKWIPVGITTCLYKETLDKNDVSNIIRQLLAGREYAKEMKIKKRLFKETFKKITL